MKIEKVYPLLVNKAVRKGRTTDEVDQVIQWLTGYDSDGLKAVLDAEASYEAFFAEAPKMNPNRKKITGTICGVRVENIEEPLMQEIRNCTKITCTIYLPFSPIAPAQNPQCTPVHLRFWTGTLEEKFCATCTCYFCTVPKVFRQTH